MSVTSAHTTTCKRRCAFPSQQQATDEHCLQPLNPSPDRVLYPSSNLPDHSKLTRSPDCASITPNTKVFGVVIRPPCLRYDQIHGYLIKTNIWAAFVTIPEEANRHMDQQPTVRLAIRQRKHSAPSSCGGIRRLARLGKASGPLMARQTGQIRKAVSSRWSRLPQGSVCSPALNRYL